MRKFRRLPESAVRIVERPSQLTGRRVDQIDVERTRVAAGHCANILQLGRKLLRRS